MLQLMGAFDVHQNVTGAIVAKGFDTAKACIGTNAT